ncbi:MAG TPA: NfeD family protein [Bacteroidales bacterium]|nr:NfeD family protein [Bacteroidales bacterium]
MLLIIVLLVLVGVILLVLEFVVIPGITIAGVGGFILSFAGIFLAYRLYGTAIGTYTLLGSIILFVIAIVYALKAKTWKKVALNSEIDSKVNVIDHDKFHVGDTGIASSRLAPMGKVRINGIMVEAKSTGIYIPENTEVEVIKVNGSNITVKPLK